MAPVAKKPTKPVTKKVKKVKRKRLNETTVKPKEKEPLPPATRLSDEPPLKKVSLNLRMFDDASILLFCHVVQVLSNILEI